MEKEITIDIATETIGGRSLQDIVHSGLVERKYELKMELLEHIRKWENAELGYDFSAFDEKMDEIILEIGDTLRLIAALKEEAEEA